jgi:hypothetical protein
MGDFDAETIERLFSFHAPKPGQPERYMAIRNAAKNLAIVISLHTPPGADQSAAIRLLRQAVQTANASIALEP